MNGKKIVALVCLFLVSNSVGAAKSGPKALPGPNANAPTGLRQKLEALFKKQPRQVPQPQPELTQAERIEAMIREAVPRFVADITGAELAEQNVEAEVARWRREITPITEILKQNSHFSDASEEELTSHALNLLRINKLRKTVKNCPICWESVGGNVQPGTVAYKCPSSRTSQEDNRLHRPHLNDFTVVGHQKCFVEDAAYRNKECALCRLPYSQHLGMSVHY